MVEIFISTNVGSLDEKSGKYYTFSPIRSNSEASMALII
jgi:hypothetical protein